MFAEDSEGPGVGPDDQTVEFTKENFNKLLEVNDGLLMRIQGLEAKLNGQEIRISQLTDKYHVARYKAMATKEILSDLLHAVTDAHEGTTDEM